MRTVISIIFISIFICCKSQDLKSGCWLPEIYVDSLQNHSFKNIGPSIKPVHSVYVSGDTVLIMSYGGEYLQAQIAKSNNGRLEVTNFSNLIALSYPEAIDHTKSKCFLYQDDNYLIMELQNGNDRKSIRFINGRGNLVFNSPADVYFRYKLSGVYLLGNQQYTFFENGKIEGELWDSFGLLRNGYLARDKYRGDYRLVVFYGKHGGEKYAVQRTDDQLFIYTYTSADPSSFDIKVSDKPVHVLSRYQ